MRGMNTRTPPTSPQYVPPTFRLRRMAVLAALATASGLVFGDALGVGRGAVMATLDPNWWLHNGRRILTWWAVGGGVVGLLVAPLVAACLWRKNLLAVLPAVSAPPVLVGLAFGTFAFGGFWHPPVTLVLMVVSAVGAVVGLRFLARDAIRPFRPGYCPACAYALRGQGDDRCPECGVIVRLPGGPDGQRLRRAISHRHYCRVRRPWVVAVAGFGVLLAVAGAVECLRAVALGDVQPVTYAALPTANFTWPSATTFLGHWNSGLNRGRSGMAWGRRPGRTCDASHVFFPAGDARDRIVEVLVPGPGAPPDAPPMQVRLGYLYRSSRGDQGPYPGDPWVICNLDSAQAAAVWKYDLPPPLIDALISAADASEWEPLDPRRGVVSKPNVEVDAGPFFP